MQPFAYSDLPHSRRHGPQGYANLESYRPWVRDDFAFRCVYCLARESWGKGHYGFQLDHLVPQSRSPSRARDYENLCYACATCNELKSNIDGLADPCEMAYAQCLRVREDGTMLALNDQGTILIKVLRLDNPENTEYRRLIFEILHLAENYDGLAYRRLMGFPENLPNLAAQRPPGGNSRPEGVKQSFFCAATTGRAAGNVLAPRFSRSPLAPVSFGAQPCCERSTPSAAARSRSSKRLILPVAVLGSESTKITARGYLCRAVLRLTKS